VIVYGLTLATAYLYHLWQVGAQMPR